MLKMKSIEICSIRKSPKYVICQVVSKLFHVTVRICNSVLCLVMSYVSRCVFGVGSCLVVMFIVGN